MPASTPTTPTVSVTPLDLGAPGSSAKAAMDAGRVVSGVGSVARSLAAGAGSTNIPLTASCTRISIVAVGTAIRYSIGSDAQTATTTSHLILEGERLDISVPIGANIAAKSNSAAIGTLEISELV